MVRGSQHFILMLKEMGATAENRGLGVIINYSCDKDHGMLGITEDLVDICYFLFSTHLPLSG